MKQRAPILENAPFVRNTLRVDLKRDEALAFDAQVEKEGLIKSKLIRKLLVEWLISVKALAPKAESK